MKNKLQLLAVVATLLFSFNVKADTIKKTKLNLYNPDVRKCLIESSKQEGWDLKATYLDANENLVLVFSKGNEDKRYISN